MNEISLGGWLFLFSLIGGLSLLFVAAFIYFGGWFLRLIRLHKERKHIENASNDKHTKTEK